LWVLNGDRLLAIDPGSGAVKQTVDTPAGVQSIAGSGDKLWLVAYPEGAKPALITLHAAADAKRLAGPVELPGSLSSTRSVAQELVAFDNKLWLTLSFFDAGLVMVEQAA
jgi:hypothetical protein